MKVQKKICFSILLAMALFFRAVDGYCTEQTPEQFVREFYQWYFKEDVGNNLPHNNDAIYKYLFRPLVKDIREDRSGVCYFKKVGMESVEWRDVVPVVRKSIGLGDGVHLVPVALVLESRTIDVVVVVKEKEDGLRITAIFDTYPLLVLEGDMHFMHVRFHGTEGECGSATGVERVEQSVPYEE